VFPLSLKCFRELLAEKPQPLSPPHTIDSAAGLPLLLAPPPNVLTATLSILESVICVAEMAGACLFCLRSLATAAALPASSGQLSAPQPFQTSGCNEQIFGAE